MDIGNSKLICDIIGSFMYILDQMIQLSLAFYLHLVIFKYQFFTQMNSNKDILDKAIGRPAMMAFMLLVGTYVTTGQLIPGVF